jgi:small conductance mechanosensitive channel
MKWLSQLFEKQKFQSTMEQYASQIYEKIFNIGLRVVFTFLFFLIGIWIIRLIRKVIKKSLERVHADLGVQQFLDSLFKVLFTTILIFMLAVNFGVDAASIVAVLGSAGVALGLALQGSLSNFAGGVLILLLKPFKVGDYIIEDTNKNAGTVTEIQLFYTKLLTLDKKIVILPNGTLANTSLVNHTTSLQRKLNLVFYISYESDFKKAKEIILNCLQQQEHILKDEDCMVVLDALEQTGVKIVARAVVLNEHYFQVKWSLLEKVKEGFDQESIIFQTIALKTLN